MRVSPCRPRLTRVLSYRFPHRRSQPAGFPCRCLTASPRWRKVMYHRRDRFPLIALRVRGADDYPDCSSNYVVGLDGSFLFPDSLLYIYRYSVFHALFVPLQCLFAGWIFGSGWCTRCLSSWVRWCLSSSSFLDLQCRGVARPPGFNLRHGRLLFSPGPTDFFIRVFTNALQLFL
jgi:hypothetical protein